MTTTQSPITVSLEWAEKLRDAGYPQGFSGVFAVGETDINKIIPKDTNWAYFYWVDHRKDYRIGEPNPILGTIYDNYPQIAAAPTCEELLRKLPESIEWVDGMKRYIEIVYHSQWVVRYFGRGEPQEQFLDDSLANACAKMWIHLSDNKLLPDTL